MTTVQSDPTVGVPDPRPVVERTADAEWRLVGARCTACGYPMLEALDRCPVCGGPCAAARFGPRRRCSPRRCCAFRCRGARRRTPSPTSTSTTGPRILAHVDRTDVALARPGYASPVDRRRRSARAGRRERASLRASEPSSTVFGSLVHQHRLRLVVWIDGAPVTAWRDVAVQGVGTSLFGKQPELSAGDLVRRAVFEALDDAGSAGDRCRVRRHGVRRPGHGAAGAADVRHHRGADPDDRERLRLGHVGVPRGVPAVDAGRASSTSSPLGVETMTLHFGGAIHPEAHRPRGPPGHGDAEHLRDVGQPLPARVRRHARAAGDGVGEEPRPRDGQRAGPAPARRRRSTRCSPAG